MIITHTMEVCRAQQLATNSQGQGHNLDSNMVRSVCSLAWTAFTLSSPNFVKMFVAIRSLPSMIMSQIAWVVKKLCTFFFICLHSNGIIQLSEINTKSEHFYSALWNQYKTKLTFLFPPTVFILKFFANFDVLDRLWVMALDLVNIIHFTFVRSLNLNIFNRIITILAQIVNRHTILVKFDIQPNRIDHFWVMALE